MEDTKQQALIIYETICATSADRPFGFRSMEQMLREVAVWQADNPALTALRQAPPEVKTAFLSQSVGWLKAESRDHANFRVTSTLIDAIRHALEAASKPLPAELVLKLLTELRQDAFTRFAFPFDQFLSVFTREEVTEEIRAELRLLHLQYAPSPTGKIDERTLATRNRIAELMHVEGEKQLDPGRGPWSQIVFDEIAGKDEITRSGWQCLLEHCRALQQAVPAMKWKNRSHELISALGESVVQQTLQRWLALLDQGVGPSKILAGGGIQSILEPFLGLRRPFLAVKRRFQDSKVWTGPLQGDVAAPFLLSLKHHFLGQ